MADTYSEWSARQPSYGYRRPVGCSCYNVDVSELLLGMERLVWATDRNIGSVLAREKCPRPDACETEFREYGVTKWGVWENCRCNAGPELVEEVTVRRHVDGSELAQVVHAAMVANEPQTVFSGGGE